MEDTKAEVLKNQKKNTNIYKLLQNRHKYRLTCYSKACRVNNPNRNPRLHIRKRVKVEQKDECVSANEDEIVNCMNKLPSNEKIISAKYFWANQEQQKNQPNGNCIKTFLPSKLKEELIDETTKDQSSDLGIKSESNLVPLVTSTEELTFERTSKDSRINPYINICPTTDETYRKLINKSITNISRIRSEKVTLNLDFDHQQLLQIAMTTLPRLLVFSESEDTTINNVKLAANELRFNFLHFDQTEEIRHPTDIIIIDMRAAKSISQEVRNICKCAEKCSRKIPVVALIKQTHFENKKIIVKDLLQAGFTRCITESSSYTGWYNELYTLFKWDLQICTKSSIYGELFSALLLNSKDIIMVLDSQYIIRICSPSIKEHLKFNVSEIIGESFKRRFISNQLIFESLESTLSAGFTWKSQLQVKAQNYELISTQCNASPIFYDGTTFTFVLLTISILGQGRTTVTSSFSGYSDFVAGNVEEALKLIIYAQSKLNEGNEVTSILTKAINLFDNINTVKSFRTVEPIPEPVVSDLISALLESPVKPTGSILNMLEIKESRRSANIQSISNKEQNFLSWSYNIWQNKLKSKRILIDLGLEILNYFHAPQTLNCDLDILKTWLIVIDKQYHDDVPYHNSTHAADVLQACAVFVSNYNLSNFLDSLNIIACLIAAIAHDLDHMGKTNAFLCNSNHSLAITYNDMTVLENYHVSLMFQLTLSDDRVNIFKNLNEDEYKLMRFKIIDLIVSTDMTKHFDILTNFVNELSTIPIQTDDVMNVMYSPEKIILIHRMIIKCADVSNPSRKFKVTLEWCRRITEEYCKQTDEEKALGLPVVMPMFDRDTCSVCKAQIGFIEYIINDMFEAWNAFIDMPEIVKNLRKNYKSWKKLDQMGISTIDAIKEIQQAIANDEFNI